jgi:hypothetical protein
VDPTVDRFEAGVEDSTFQRLSSQVCESNLEPHEHKATLRHWLGTHWLKFWQFRLPEL